MTAKEPGKRLNEVGMSLCGKEQLQRLRGNRGNGARLNTARDYHVLSSRVKTSRDPTITRRLGISCFKGG